MASAHCVLAPFFPPSSHNSVTTLKTVASLSSSPTPSKPTKRKNHLRLKLLKTLPNPYPPTSITPQQTPLNPNETLELPREEEFNTNSNPNLAEFLEEENDEQKELDTISTQNLDEFPDLIEEERENDERLQEVQVTAITEAESSLTTRSVIEIVLCIVGFFIIQTIITVWWVLRKENAENPGNVEKQAELEVEKKGFWFGRSKEVKPESLVYVDESELKEKIVEIRAMAKEVREIEAKKKGNSSDVIEFDEDVSVSKPVVSDVKNNIQKEVDGKLSVTEKRLLSLREKAVTSRVSLLNNSEEGKDKKELERLNAKVKDENLVFRKKPKFKSGLSKPGSRLKGFQSEKASIVNEITRSSTSQNTDIRSNGEGNDGINGSARGISLDLLNGGSRGTMPDTEGESHSSVENALGKTTLKSGGKREVKDSSSKEVKDKTTLKSEKEGKASKPAQARKFEKNKSRSGNIRESSDELLETKDSSKLKTNSSDNLTRHVGNKRVVNSRDELATIGNDMWWLKLPYALAILMRRSSESEGPGGLYSLKMDDGSSSHIVAFEDQRDASNFCHILDAFFDELGDLIADVIPLSIKELKDEVEASAMKIIVVRKGQLKLYAGQPLADVELTLRSLVR